MLRHYEIWSDIDRKYIVFIIQLAQTQFVHTNGVWSDNCQEWSEIVHGSPCISVTIVTQSHGHVLVSHNMHVYMV